MSNMSYCRFQNTNADLKDCYDNMDDDDLSFEERMARWRIIQLCVQIAQDYSWEQKPKKVENVTKSGG